MSNGWSAKNDRKSVDKKIVLVKEAKRHRKYCLDIFTMDILKERKDYFSGYYAAYNFLNELVCYSGDYGLQPEGQFRGFLQSELELRADAWAIKIKDLLGKVSKTSDLNVREMRDFCEKYGLFIFTNLVVFGSAEMDELREFDNYLHNKVVNEYRAARTGTLFVLYYDKKQWSFYKFLSEPSRKANEENVIRVSVQIFDSLHQIREVSEQLRNYIFSDHLLEQEISMYESYAMAKGFIRNNFANGNILFESDEIVMSDPSLFDDSIDQTLPGNVKKKTLDLLSKIQLKVSPV